MSSVPCDDHTKHPECRPEMGECVELLAINGQKLLIMEGDLTKVDYPDLRSLDNNPSIILRGAMVSIGALQPDTIQAMTFDNDMAKARSYFLEELQDGDPGNHLNRQQIDALVNATTAYHHAPIFEVLDELRKQFRERGRQQHATSTYHADILGRIVLLEELDI